MDRKLSTISSPAGQGWWAPPTRPSHRVMLAILALTAPLFALLTAQVRYTTTALRDMAGPVIGVELAIVAMLLLFGESLMQRLTGISRWVMVGTGLWLGSAAVSTTLATANPVAARVHLAITCLHVLFAMVLWSEFRRHPELRRPVLVAIACSLAVYALMVFAFAAVMFGRPDFDWLHFGMAVTNVRHLGYYAVALTGLAAGLLATHVEPQQQRFATVLLTIGLTLAFFSGGRGAAGASLIALFALGGLAQRDKLGAYAASAAIATIIAVVFSAAFIPSSEYGLFRIILFSVTTGEAGYTTGRTLLWRDALELILQHPLFGHGEGQFRWISEHAAQNYNHPHNMLLQLLVQWGMVGTVLFLALVAKPLATAIPAISRDREASFPALGALLGLTAIAMIDGPFFYVYCALISVACLAVLTTANAGRTAQRNAETSRSPKGYLQ